MTQDAVQKYGGASNATIAYFESDLVAMIRGRGNHPSIIQWETFNEDDCWKVFVTKPHTVFVTKPHTVFATKPHMVFVTKPHSVFVTKPHGSL